MTGVDLDRFVAAQDDHGTWVRALGELRAGRKTSHWMWFVFPQLAGLGRSPTAVRYAVPGADAARAYLAHAVLGPRLVEATSVLLDLDETDPGRVLGGIDAMKLRSSMTLFEQVATEHPEFARVLEQYFDGRRDDVTLELLESQA